MTLRTRNPTPCGTTSSTLVTSLTVNLLFKLIVNVVVKYGISATYEAVETYALRSAELICLAEKE